MGLCCGSGRVGFAGGDLSRYRHWKGPFPRFMGGHEYSGEIAGSAPRFLRSRSATRRCSASETSVACAPTAGWAVRTFVLRSDRSPRPAAVRGVCGCRHAGARVWTFPQAEGALVLARGGCRTGGVRDQRCRARAIQPGQWAAVVGLGAIGHFTCQVLCGIGVRVIGIDISDNRLQAAEPYCRETINSTLQRSRWLW